MGEETGQPVNRLRHLAIKLRKTIKWRTADALFATGLGAALHRNRPGGRILNYHGVDTIDSLEHNTRFVSASTLERHLAYFREHFEVVTMAEYFAGRRAPDRLTLAITFDDGYANNLERVLPVLDRVGVPAIFFVTGCTATDGEILWPDLLDLAIPAVTGPVEIGGERWARGRRGELAAEATGETLKLRCKRSSMNFIGEMMSTLRPYFERRNPENLTDYWRHLDSKGIRRLSASSLVTIGSHGAHHTCLGTIDHDAAVDELRRSKNYLETAIDLEIVDLAYPDGSYTRRLVEDAAELGFTRQCVVDFLHPEDAGDPRLAERMGNNPFVSWDNQLWAILAGRY